MLNVNYFYRRRRLDLPIVQRLVGWASIRSGIGRDAASRGLAVAGVGTLDLQVQEITEEDWLLAVGARTAEADHAAEAVAVRAALLAEVAGLARWALVDGVLGQGRSAAQGSAEQSFL